MTAADQPTAGVALLAEAQKIAAELHPELFSEVTRTAHRAASPFSIEEARADKVRDALMFLAAQATVRAIRTPASGPVEADDRLAVSREELIQIIEPEADYYTENAAWATDRASWRKRKIDAGAKADAILALLTKSDEAADLAPSTPAG